VPDTARPATACAPHARAARAAPRARAGRGWACGGCAHRRPPQRYKHGAGEKASAKLKAKENSKKAKRLKARRTPRSPRLPHPRR